MGNDWQAKREGTKKKIGKGEVAKLIAPLLSFSFAYVRLIMYEKVCNGM